MRCVIVGMLIEDQLIEMKKYLMEKLRGFGCPDSFIESTADTMLNDLLKIMTREEGGGK